MGWRLAAAGLALGLLAGQVAHAQGVERASRDEQILEGLRVQQERELRRVAERQEQLRREKEARMREAQRARREALELARRREEEEERRGYSLAVERAERPPSPSARQERRLAAHVERILRSCNFNSEVDAELIAWAPEPPVAWRHWRVRDHVIVHYRSARTFETHSGLVRVRTILLPLPPGELPGQPITLAGSEGTAIAYTKCDGAALFDLVCDPELRSELFAEVGVGCSEHEPWRREPDRD